MDFAQRVPLPKEQSGRILSWRTIVIGNLLSLLPMILLAAGVIRTLIAIDNWRGLPNGQNVGNPNVLFNGILLVSGCVSAAIGFYWFLRNVNRFSGKYVRWVADNELHSRADRIVSPDDLDAVFVEIVPRRNWRRLMLETATDIGYLLVDKSQKRVLFEGDCERYMIPAGAISSCQTESARIGDMEMWFTVIRAVHGSGVEWEVPVVFRGDMGILGKVTRAERARTIKSQIDVITDASGTV